MRGYIFEFPAFVGSSFSCGALAEPLVFAVRRRLLRERGRLRLDGHARAQRQQRQRPQQEQGTESFGLDFL